MPFLVVNQISILGREAGWANKQSVYLDVNVFNLIKMFILRSQCHNQILALRNYLYMLKNDSDWRLEVMGLVCTN